MFCIKCGSKLEDGADFCTSCGKSLEHQRDDDVGLNDFASATQTARNMIDNYLSPYKNMGNMAGRVRNTMIGLAVLLVLAFLLLIPLGGLGLFLWVLVAIAVLSMVVKLLLSRGEALRLGEKEVIPSIMKYVSWNPTEGVLFLKNKSIVFVDDNPTDGGGVALIFQILGEELSLRVPLEIQTFRFSDKNVLTREYISVGVQCSIYWKIVDLQRFYSLVSTEIRHLGNGVGNSVESSAKHPRLHAAEHWLKSMAEEETRRVFAQVATGLLLASRVADDLGIVTDLVGADQTGGFTYGSVTDDLAGRIAASITAQTAQYGIELHRVALQEIELPQEICRMAVEAAKSAYLPIIAQRQAAANATISSAKLRADAEVLGASTVSAREMLSVSPNSPLGSLADFLTTVVAKAKP